MGYRTKFKRFLFSGTEFLEQQISDFKSIFQFDLDIDLDGLEEEILLEKTNSEVIEPEAQKFAWKAVQNFLEDFVGVFITGFASHQGDIENLNEKVNAKMITEVKLAGKDFWLKLSKIDNSDGGYLKISPTITGQFLELESQQRPEIEARFRLMFLGGDAFDYLDFAKNGMISYHSEFKG